MLNSRGNFVDPAIPPKEKAGKQMHAGADRHIVGL